MREPIVLPDLGASAPRLGLWLVHVGESVYEGERVVEVMIDAAVFEVPASAAGRLVEILARPDDALQTGQILGYIEVAPPRAARPQAAKS